MMLGDALSAKGAQSRVSFFERFFPSLSNPIDWRWMPGLDRFGCKNPFTFVRELVISTVFKNW